jgi:hypothetical protein
MRNDQMAKVKGIRAKLTEKEIACLTKEFAHAASDMHNAATQQDCDVAVGKAMGALLKLNGEGIKAYTAELFLNLAAECVEYATTSAAIGACIEARVKDGSLLQDELGLISLPKQENRV